ncbi:hypothetical protein SDC9_164328 [bioreactor metagenome]|uniref:Uncharacterized protein n=1 Tax=bioreactor metagenome TaxID=1076179 RepID=A0A645FU17_9ZZZZ|nr:hypothetical protein [Paludibacter sp.]
METNKIDEGHIFDYEDIVFFIKWKVSDLKDQGYSDQDILEFDYCDDWYEYASVFIDKINKSNNNE